MTVVWPTMIKMFGSRHKDRIEESVVCVVV